MADNAFFKKLLQLTQKRLDKRLIEYKPNLTKSIGVVPSKNIPSSSPTVKGGITLARDLGGTASAPEVIGFYGRDLLDSVPNNGQAYLWVAANNRFELSDTTPASSGYGTTIGDGSTTAFTITHNLGTRDVLVMVHQLGTPYDYVQPNISATTINTVTVTFAVAPATDTFRVIVGTGGGVTPGGGVAQAFNRQLSWYEDTTLTAANSKGPLRRIDATVTLVSCYIYVKTVPTGAAIIVDIKKASTPNGTYTSIFSATPQIAASADNGTSSSFAAATLVAGDYLRMDITQVGSTIAGAGLTVDLNVTGLGS